MGLRDADRYEYDPNMADIWKQYTNEVYAALRYLASWPPSSRVEVGDIAVMQDRSLERQLSLRDLDIDTAVLHGSEIHDRGWASSGTVKLSANASASGPVHPGVTGGTECEVSFHAKHAILLRAGRSREDSMDRLDRVKREMLRLHNEGKWNSEWVLVTHVVHAGSLLVLVSNQKGASARLSVSGSVGADALALALARSNVTLVGASGMAYEEHSEQDATPLYLAIRVQERVGRKPSLTRIGKRGRARAVGGDFEVAEVTF